MTEENSSVRRRLWLLALPFLVGYLYGKWRMMTAEGADPQGESAVTSASDEADEIDEYHSLRMDMEGAKEQLHQFMNELEDHE